MENLKRGCQYNSEHNSTFSDFGNSPAMFANVLYQRPTFPGNTR